MKYNLDIPDRFSEILQNITVCFSIALCFSYVKASINTDVKMKWARAHKLNIA